MATTTEVKLRRGTTEENDTFLGAEAEVTVDTTLKQLRIHDGQTMGGHKIPKDELVVHTTDYATTENAGIVKPDGTTISVDADGTIHTIKLPETDDTTISLNSDNKLQAIGELNKNDNNPIYEWKGTLAEYNALTEYNDNWVYYITDDSISVLSSIDYSTLINKPTINNVVLTGNKTGTDLGLASYSDIHNNTVTITQGGVTKGSFTLNQNEDTTIALDAGGTGNVTDVKVDGTSVVTEGVANIDLTDYAKLTDIPTVNNNTVTINQGGTQKGTFTLNQNSDVTIDLDAGGTTTDTDNLSITKNTANKIQTVGTINQNNIVEALKEWKGTLEEYNAIPVKDNTTKYYIMDDNVPPAGAVTDVLVNGTSVVSGGIASVSVPTVNDSTITITQGGIQKGTFTLNQGNNKTIALDSGGSSVSIDNLSITNNPSNQIQAIGVIDNNNSLTAIKTWTGTLAQYNDIENKDPDTLYNVTDDVTGGNSVYTKNECDNKFVHLTDNETITGAKTFVGSTRIYRKSESIENEVTPASNQWLNGILFQDKNEKRIGSIEVSKTTTGENLLCMTVNGWNNDAIAYGDTLGVGISADGSVQRTFARTPAANSNDTNIATTAWVHSNAAGLVMPSSSYINLTIGASETSYTAPADGWVYFCATTTSNNLGYGLYSPNTSLRSFIRVDTSGQVFAVYIPVKQGHSFHILYEGAITGGIFRFIYAEGVKPN